MPLSNCIMFTEIMIFYTMFFYPITSFHILPQQMPGPLKKIKYNSLDIHTTAYTYLEYSLYCINVYYSHRVQNNPTQNLAFGPSCQLHAWLHQAPIITLILPVSFYSTHEEHFINLQILGCNKKSECLQEAHEVTWRTCNLQTDSTGGQD